MKVRVPEPEEEHILRENGLDPNEYAVIHREENAIYLLCYRTRDSITIRKGDRPWDKKKPHPVLQTG